MKESKRVGIAAQIKKTARRLLSRVRGGASDRRERAAAQGFTIEDVEAELLRASREEALRRKKAEERARVRNRDHPRAQEGPEAHGPDAAGAQAGRAWADAPAGGWYPAAEDETKAGAKPAWYRRRFWRALFSTIEKLVVVASIAVLVATIWLPVLRIYGSSMTPTLYAGDIVVTFKGSSFTTGDVVGLYVGNRLLVKRVIAGPGQWVDIREDGTVHVDGRELHEPYLTEKALGDCNIELPYQVPESRYFVMGDHRSTSVDSRHSTVGSVAGDDIVGRIMFRVWPMSGFGRVDRQG